MQQGVLWADPWARTWAMAAIMRRPDQGGMLSPFDMRGVSPRLYARGMRRLLALVPVSLLLAACGGESVPSPSVPAPPSQSPSPSSSVTSSASPTPAGTRVGETNKDANYSTTVEEVVQAQTFDGKNYAAALVKSCVDVMPPEFQVIAFGWGSWSVVGVDRASYPSKFVSDGIPQSPRFPMSQADGVFRAGECARGWVTFDVPAGVQVDAVRYGLEAAEPWTWKVG